MLRPASIALSSNVPVSRSPIRSIHISSSSSSSDLSFSRRWHSCKRLLLFYVILTLYEAAVFYSFVMDPWSTPPPVHLQENKQLGDVPTLLLLRHDRLDAGSASVITIAEAKVNDLEVATDGIELKRHGTAVDSLKIEENADDVKKVVGSESNSRSPASTKPSAMASKAPFVSLSSVDLHKAVEIRTLRRERRVRRICTSTNRTGSEI